MAIENTYLLGKNITLGCGFDLQAKAPLDSRQTVPAFAGLQALIDGNAAYEGMIVYDEETKKTYQAQMIDDVLAFREFGINEAELKDLIASETTAAMEFKGAATALPENPAKGDMYKITATFKVGEEDAKVGDSIVYDGEQWFIIPSGDDIEDTWRPVTGVDNDSTLTFAAGDKLEKTVAADGTITYKHEAIDAPTNMNEEGDEQTRTYITQLIADNHGHIIGFKTATENVEDTNTTYEFEGQSDEATSVYFQVKSSDAEAAEVIYLNAYSKNEADAAIEAAKTEAANQDAVVLAEAQAYANTELAKKVDKVEGKDLIDTAEIERLATLHNYDDAEVKADIAKKVDKVEGHSLVADTEIARLANVDNYDDEEVRGLIADNAKAIEELGTMSKETADDYVKKADATGYDDILTKTEAQGAYQPKGDYASKAQGERADRAVTDVTISETGGLGTYVTGALELSADIYDGEDGAHSLLGIDVAIKKGGITTEALADKNVTKDKLADALKAEIEGKADGEHTHTAADITDFATEVAKVKVDEAVKATQDGNGNVIADTYAEKATTLAGYGITDAYTTTQVDEAIEGAKTDASNKDAVVLAEAQKHAEEKVQALADTVYTQAQVDALLSAAQTWGEF